MPVNSIRVIDARGVTISRTNLKSANRMIARGTARWRGSAVEMIEADPRVQLSTPRLTDGSGMASIRAIVNLPIAGRERGALRLLTGKPGTGPSERVFISSHPAEFSDPPAKIPTWNGEPLVA